MLLNNNNYTILYDFFINIKTDQVIEVRRPGIIEDDEKKNCE